MKGRLLAIVMVGAALLTATARAQTHQTPRTSLAFERADPQAVFGALAVALGNLEARVDPAVTAPVTITVQDVTAKTAMTAICESIGCEWSIEGTTLVVRPATGHVSGIAHSAHNVQHAELAQIQAAGKKVMGPGSQFSGMPLSKVLSFIAAFAQLGGPAKPRSPDPLVTIDVSGRTVAEAVAAVCESVGAHSIMVAFTVGPAGTPVPSTTFTPLAAGGAGTKHTGASAPRHTMLVTPTLDCGPVKSPLHRK